MISYFSLWSFECGLSNIEVIRTMVCHHSTPKVCLPILINLNLNPPQYKHIGNTKFLKSHHMNYSGCISSVKYIVQKYICEFKNVLFPLWETRLLCGLYILLHSKVIQSLIHVKICVGPDMYKWIHFLFLPKTNNKIRI